MKQKMDTGTSTRHDTNRDYSTLTNHELQRLLRERVPTMTLVHVTDENRETAIAMLMISEEK